MKLLMAIACAGLLLTGCERHNDDGTPKDPGTFLRPGGDVVIGAK